MAGRTIDASETEIIRHTLKMLQTEGRVTYQEMEASLLKLQKDHDAKAYAESLGFNWQSLAFTYDAKSINAFANDRRQSTNNRGTLGALYVWLRYQHGDAYMSIESNVFIPENEPFVDAARRHFGRSQPVSKDIKTLSGRYRFFRPFYRDPNNQVMICSLEIGREEALSYDCILHMNTKGRLAKTCQSLRGAKLSRSTEGSSPFCP